MLSNRHTDTHTDTQSTVTPAAHARRGLNIYSYRCGTCEKVYQKEADKDKLWIGCDVCDKWYCGDCENLSLPPDVDI